MREGRRCSRPSLFSSGSLASPDPVDGAPGSERSVLPHSVGWVNDIATG